MMETTVEYLGGVKFEATARGHRVLCDQPRDKAGDDDGMSPPEFLLVSLGACAAYYAVAYLRTRSLPAEGVKVRVTAEKNAGGPPRLDRFRIEVTAPPLEPRHEEGLLRAVKSCLIHNTLLSAPAIETVLETAVPAAV